jgi:hypothetical protein
VTESDNVHRATGLGAYEVWFLTFSDPASGRGYWIRSTYHAPRHGPASAGVWFAWFDPTDPTRTFGIHRTSSSWSLDPEVFDVRVGEAQMSSGRAQGQIEGDGRQATWALEWPTGGPSYLLLPQAMYRGGIAPTKSHEIVDAPGQQGHLYGTRHAERWAWAHCSAFGNGAVVHALTAQGKRGPFRMPFLTFVGVRWQGQWIRLSKVGLKPDFALGTWRIDVQNRKHRLTGVVEAPSASLLRVRYEDPDGSARYCHNSEIASCRLRLFERRVGDLNQVAELESSGTTHAEWAGRTPAQAVEREFTHVQV